MRLAIAISVLAVGAVLGQSRADEPFIKVSLESHDAYIIPEDFAANHKAELIANIPGGAKIDSFWTPPEQDVRVADRVFRDAIDQAVKDPSLFFPSLASDNPDRPASADEDLERERRELVLVAQNYSAYERQYVGVVIDGVKLVLCNYAAGTKRDPATEYIFMDKFFSETRTRFLQARIDAHWKTCTNVSRVGTWQAQERR